MKLKCQQRIDKKNLQSCIEQQPGSGRKNYERVSRSDPHPFLGMGGDLFKSTKIEFRSANNFILKRKRKS
jgi:hypothetical protein